MATVLQIPKTAKVYLNKPYVQVYLDVNNQILTSRWCGFCTFDEIKAIAGRILDAVAFDGVKKVLYDAIEMEILDDESQKYIAEEFTKRMISAGITHSATVFPEDIFAKFGMDDIQGHQNHIRIASTANNKYFDSFDEAVDWLKKV